MGARFQSPGWRRCRVCVRWVRIAILLLILTLLVCGAYLNEIGLPKFLKDRLVQRLHARGVDLRFSRLRLRYYRGIVADNVRFGTTDAAAPGPHFSGAEVELKLDHAALRHFQFVINSLIVHGGEFVLPVADTNAPPLEVNSIETQVRFLPGDQWELDGLKAAFAGARMMISGSVTNAPAIRDWKMFQAGAQAQPGAGQHELDRIAELIGKIKFADVPELTVAVHGDGRDPISFNGTIVAKTRGVQTPWGVLDGGELVVEVPPLDAAHPQPRASVVLRAQSARLRLGPGPGPTTRDFDLHLVAEMDPVETNCMHGRLDLTAGQFVTQWAQARNAHLTADWTHALTNAIPASGRIKLQLDDIRTRWANAATLNLDATMGPGATNAAPPDAGWGAWAGLAPYRLDWEANLSGLHAESQGQTLDVHQVVCGGGWRAPELTLTNLHTELYGGRLDMKAALDVATRAASFDVVSDFDAHKISPLLGTYAVRWMNKYSWEQPPKLSGHGEVVLPAWTNSRPDWAREVLPTLRLEADLESGRVAYLAVPFLSCRTHIIYTNLNWFLPDLVAVRPEGQLHLLHTSDDRDHDYYFRIRSTIDIKALAPLLEPGQRGLLTNDLKLTQPPVVDAEVWGNWQVPQKIRVKARFSITNFAFRGEHADRCVAALGYTNYYVRFDHPRIERGSGYATADSVGVDFKGQRLYLTNGYGTIEPGTIIHPIGPMVSRQLEPYHFLLPPTVHADGIIPLVEEVPADAHFQIEGGPFRWQRFNLARISGRLDWVGEWLTLSNVQSQFYGGTMTGSAAFQVGHHGSTPFSFECTALDANFRMLMADLFHSTNHVEGALGCRLVVTNADTDDWKSWFGQGRVSLQDGLVWEIPIFGMLSKPLDKISPGLGESRATSGVGNFIITNSIIRTDDLQLRSKIMRLLYRGTVDFDGQTDAVVEGQLGRDIPLVGPLVSIAFMPLAKVFEYKISGGLGQPKLDPLWAPVKGMLMLPSFLLHGFRDTTPAGTNAPPPGASPP
jgi:hypothetical protein